MNETVSTKEELNNLSAGHSNLTGELKSKLAERIELAVSIQELKTEVAYKKTGWQFKLSEMDKEQLKEFGSNAEIRAAKIDNEFLVENEAIKTIEGALRTLDHEIELIKLDLKHLCFEKDILMTILMA